MSREERMVRVPESTKKEIIFRCTFCNREAKSGCDDTAIRWSGGYYVADTAVWIKTGTAYPEGGGGTIRLLPVCPDCFNAKLMPALEALAVNFETVSWDY